MSQITVEKEDLGGGQMRYVARTQGEEAELVMTRRGSDRFSADHTFTPPALRGKGVAGQLVLAMVEDARQTGFKVIPRCSYVVAQAQSHPEWQDVFVSA